MKLGKIKICYIPPKKKENILKRSQLINTLKISTTILGAMMFDIQKIYASDTTFKLDRAGNQVLVILQRIGYWGALIMAFWEVIGCIKDGDVNRVWGIVVKYAMAYGTLFTLPWIFDLIGSIFK